MSDVLPFHTDPVFRAMLLELAQRDPPELAAIGELADLLEEHGDRRTQEVRQLAKLRVYEFKGITLHYWFVAERPYILTDDRFHEPHLTPGRAALEIALRVLTLFPEGPRWRCPVSINNKPLSSELSLTLAEAQAQSPTVMLGGQRLKTAAQLYWPDPPK